MKCVKKRSLKHSYCPFRLNHFFPSFCIDSASISCDSLNVTQKMIQTICIEHFIRIILNSWNSTCLRLLFSSQICQFCTNNKIEFNLQELLREIDALDTPYQETVAASQYVLSYFNGTLQKSASQIIEKKLNDLKTHFEA